jgi:Mor family transcriptional regulator
MEELEIVTEAVVKCPICNRIIFDNETPSDELACEHVRLIYSSMAGEIFYTAKGMKGLAKKIEKGIAADEDGANLESTLERNAILAGYKLYTITTSGLACGPVSNTDYYIIG